MTDNSARSLIDVIRAKLKEYAADDSSGSLATAIEQAIRQHEATCKQSLQVRPSEIRLDFEDVKKAATAIHAASQKLHGCSILNSTCLIYAEAALMATHKPMSLKDIIRKVKFTYDFSNETTPETAVQIVLDAAGVRYVD